jgi:hypothetical protein
LSAVDDSVKKIAENMRKMAQLAAATDNWPEYQAQLERAIYELIKQAQRTE